MASESLISIVEMPWPFNTDISQYMYFEVNKKDNRISKMIKSSINHRMNEA